MGLGKVRMQEGDLKARRKLKDKEDRTGAQRALGQGLEDRGKLVSTSREQIEQNSEGDSTHGRPEGW